MNKVKVLWVIALLMIVRIGIAQTDEKAKKILDEVSLKMGSYNNMYIGFSTSLVNKEAGINEGDEAPTLGKITLQKEKYYLEYMGNTIIFNGSKLYVINNDEKEVSITEGDFEEEDGLIYPSKMLTFYQEGYTFRMGATKNQKGRMIQFIDLFPIDSNSEIKKVTLGVDKNSKHIYQLIQEGVNGVVTTLTINQFKSNQEVSPTLFSFNKKKYEELNYFID